MIITFATAWYELNSKFGKEQYYIWAENLLKNVNKFNLIVYVENIESVKLIKKLSNKNPKIYTIIYPFENLPLYEKYANLFEENHKKNTELNKRVTWKLILLWCSKQYFVEKTELEIKKKNNQYPSFTTEYYGWMDIGYFRCRKEIYGELSKEQIAQYPNNDKIKLLKKDKIHYALVEPNMIEQLKKYVYNRNNNNLPIIPIPVNQVSIAGGFFILAGGGMSSIWRENFELHLIKYLNNNYVVKDDQYIIIDIMLLNNDKFELWTENKNYNIDTWFLFQRLLF